MTTAPYVTKAQAAGGSEPDIETLQGEGSCCSGVARNGGGSSRNQERKVAEIKTTLREGEY